MPISEVFNEDCYDTLLRLDTGSVDLLLQDTPFGVTQNKWDIKPNLKKMWVEWERVAKDKCPMIFFGQHPFTSELILSNLKLFRYDLIWYKALGSGFLNVNRMPMRNHEHILVFYKKLPTYNPQMGIGMRKIGTRRQTTNGNNYGKFTMKKEDMPYDDKGTRYPESVIDITNGDRTTESDHPTQKPIDLIRYLIKTYSNENDTVFDGYLGSGTTRVSAFLENRNFIGAENDTENGYFKMQQKRFSEETLQSQLFKKAIDEPLLKQIDQLTQSKLL